MRRHVLRLWVLCWLMLVWVLLWGKAVRRQHHRRTGGGPARSRCCCRCPPVPVEGKVHPLSLLRLILVVAY